VVGEMIAGLSAFKTMFDIAKSMKDMSDINVRNIAVSNLWEQIFAAQSRYRAAMEHITELEEKLTHFETWETEKQRYELKDIGLGSKAYVIKESMRGGETPHEICATCYQHGKKSILQPRDISADKLLICPECKTQIKIGDLPWKPAIG
jgi:hypothetical protein